MKILLLDFSNIAHISRQGHNPNLELDILNRIESLIDKVNPDKLVIGNDLTKSTYRESLAPYKEERKARKQTMTKAEIARLDRMNKFRSNIGKVFQDLAIHANVMGLEFDDVASLLAKKCEDEIIIASNDKDLIQTGAKILDTKKMAYMTSKDRFGVPKHQCIEYQVLVGDSTDGIKGLNGCGSASAIELLEKYDNISNMLKLNEEDYQDSHWRIKKILDRLRSPEGLEEIRLSYKLVKLFTDYENMTEGEIKQFEEVLYDISNKKTQFEVTDEYVQEMGELGYLNLIGKLEDLAEKLVKD